MSHSQFHCHARVYLDMHGLIFETSICYWQDQPGSRRSCAEDRRRRGSGPATARAERRQGPAPGRPLRRVAGPEGAERGARGGRAGKREGLRRPSPPGPFGGLSGRVGAGLEKTSHPRRGGRTPVAEPRLWEAGTPGDARAAPRKRTAATRTLGRRGAEGATQSEHGGGRVRTLREEDPHPRLRFEGRRGREASAPPEHRAPEGRPAEVPPRGDRGVHDRSGERREGGAPPRPTAHRQPAERERPVPRTGGAARQSAVGLPAVKELVDRCP